MFFIYLNDLPKAIRSNLVLYADDSCLLYEHGDIKEIETEQSHNF